MLDKMFLEKRIQEITLHITMYTNELNSHKEKVEQLNSHILKLQGHVSEAQHLLNQFKESDDNNEKNDSTNENVPEDVPRDTK